MLATRGPNIRCCEEGRETTYKSRPTMFSKTELFPLDCEPTTAIWGKSMGFWTWRRVNKRCQEGGALGRRSSWRIGSTYPYGREDILEFVDQRNQAGVIDVYPVVAAQSVS